jgi:hypothetical protein
VRRLYCGRWATYLGYGDGYGDGYGYVRVPAEQFIFNRICLAGAIASDVDALTFMEITRCDSHGCRRRLVDDQRLYGEWEYRDHGSTYNGYHVPPREVDA